MCVTESTTGRQTRRRSVFNVLLVFPILVCPLLFATGTCCSAPKPATALEVGTVSCACCQHEDQLWRTRRSVPSPHAPTCQCSNVTVPVIVPVIVSVPRQRASLYRDLVGGEASSNQLGASGVWPVSEGALTPDAWGRRLCVSHGVLIC